MAMMGLARSGFTAAQTEAALHAVTGARKVAARHWLVDSSDGSIIRELKSVIDCTINGRSADAIWRTASYKFRKQAITLPAYSELMKKGSGLLFYLRMNESSGNLSDSSGNARTFTSNGSPIYKVASLLAGDPLDTAISFNGSNSYFSIADASWMDVTQFTISLWMKSSVTTGFPCLFDRYSAGNEMIRLNHGNTGFGNPGELRLSLDFTTGSPTTYQTSAKTIDGYPHHILVTYDQQFVKIYVDSFLVLKTPETRTLKNVTQAMRIGTTSTGDNFFNGVIDEAAMWSRALTSAEGRELYQSGAADYSEFDSSRDKVMPEWGIRVGSGDDPAVDYAWFPQGLYVMTSPDEGTDTSGTEIAMNCPDQSRLLIDDCFTQNYFVAAGTIYTAAVKSILDTVSGLPGYNITSTTLTLPVDREWLAGTKKADAIADLLKACIYNPLWFDEIGFARVEPYVADGLRQPEYVYTDQASGVRLPVVLNRLKSKRELDAVPNLLIVSRQDPQLGVVTTTQSNTDVRSPVSIPRRGGRVVSIFEQVETPDESNSFTAIAQRSLRDRSQVTQDVEWNSPVMPHHLFLACYTLNNTRAGVKGNFIEKEFSYSLKAGSEMRHVSSSPVTSI